MRRLAWTLAVAVEARRQATFPFRSPEAVAHARRHRVVAMVRHACRHVPFYRDILSRMGAAPDDLADADDLARLPIVERLDFQRQPERFGDPGFRQADGFVVHSSGSSEGAPRAIAHDHRAILLNAAHGERERSIIARIVGRPTGWREAVFTMPNSTTMEIQEYVRGSLALPRSMGIRRSYFPLDEDLEENARRLLEFRPQVVHGYGSYLGRLVRHAAETGRLPGELRVVTYSSDSMFDADRHYIEERLGLPVLSTYQAAEAFKIGFECGLGEGLHVNVDLYPVRIVEEGRELPPGETGDVVVSNLINRATVLLNYRLGDRAALIEGPCPCGRNLPRMTLPQGRVGEWVDRPDGGRLHVQALRALFRGEEGILAFHISQRDARHIRLSVVGAEGADRDALAESLGRRFADRLGEVRVDVEWVERLERTRGGKVRTFEREAG
jgi:phenylacetate-CoA ligase